MTAYAAENVGRIEEVLVTVQKRDERLFDVAGTVVAIRPDELWSRGVSDLRAVQSFLPAARLQMENTSTQIFLRGVGSNLDFPQLAPPSSLHVNGIYVPREATSATFFDMAGVEVLPGPQGTLYGRSTLGGIVNARFERPGAGSRLLAEAGNFEHARLSAATDLELAEGLEVRLAADYHRRDGYMASGADSADNLGLRLSVLWDPGERVALYGWLNHVAMDGAPANLVVKGVDPGTGALRRNAWLRDDPWNDRFPEPWASGLPFGQPASERYEDYGNIMAGSTLSVQTAERQSLSYEVSWLDFEVSSDYWLGAFPANKTDRYRQQTHELRWRGSWEGGSWLVGLYGYRMESDGYFLFGGHGELRTPGAVGLPVPVSIVDDHRIQGLAVFGETTLDVSDRWHVTLGARFSADERRGDGRFFTGIDLAPYDFDESYDQLDGKLSLEFDIATDTLLYAATQSGYMPGTFNPYASTPLATNEVEEAELVGYTAGFRQRWRRLGLAIEGELFYYDYEGLFGSAYNTVLNATQTFNVDQTEVLGFQLDLDWKPDERNDLDIALAWVRARYEDFDLPDGSASYDGFQAQYAPDWTLTAAWRHRVPLRSGELALELATRFEDSFFADFAHTPGGRMRAHWKTDAVVSWRQAGSDWLFSLWARNLENEAVIAATAGGSNLPSNPLGATAFLEPPRTFGVRVSYRPDSAGG